MSSSKVVNVRHQLTLLARFASLGDWVMKMAIRAAIVSPRRKDFGGAGGGLVAGPGGKKGGRRGWTGDHPRRNLSVRSLSVTVLLSFSSSKCPESCHIMNI